MLRAATPHQQLIEAATADRTLSYHCPDCGAPVILKHGRRVRAHFAHQVYAPTCSLAGETEEHLWMKQQMRAFFAPSHTEVEVALIPGHRADVVLLDHHIVIECQVSPMAIAEWERRTLDYNRQGYAVLWVWSPTRLGIAETEQELSEYDAIVLGQHGVRVAVEVLHCHYCAYGRVYTLATSGQLVAVHLCPVTRWTPSNPAQPLKVTRKLQLLPLTPVAAPAGAPLHPPTQTRLARVESEYAWWH